jgi:hypothetical protein
VSGRPFATLNDVGDPAVTGKLNADFFGVGALLSF